MNIQKTINVLHDLSNCYHVNDEIKEAAKNAEKALIAIQRVRDATINAKKVFSDEN